MLDNYDSFTYNLVHYLEMNAGFEVNTFRNDEITLEEVDNYDIIILSPGPGLPIDAGILLELIKTYAPTKKILGVCLGMQAIGEAFGGELKNLDTVFHGVSTQLQVTETTDLLFKNLPQQFNVGRYHSWVIDSITFPKDLTVTAVDENKNIMALKHKTYPLYGVQFHPESILTENGKELIANFLNI